jgi:hypothetical protein
MSHFQTAQFSILAERTAASTGGQHIRALSERRGLTSLSLTAQFKVMADMTSIFGSAKRFDGHVHCQRPERVRVAHLEQLV